MDFHLQVAQTYAQENGLFFLETSAKTAANVNEIFHEIGKPAISKNISQHLGLPYHQASVVYIKHPLHPLFTSYKFVSCFYSKEIATVAANTKPIWHGPRGSTSRESKHGFLLFLGIYPNYSYRHQARLCCAHILVKVITLVYPPDLYRSSTIFMHFTFVEESLSIYICYKCVLLYLRMKLLFVLILFKITRIL